MPFPELKPSQANKSFDEAKFSTQRLVTYALLLIFTYVVANVLFINDQAERSTIIQTVINFMTFVVGYWIGTSKAASDSNEAMGQIASSAAPDQAKAVAAARAPAPTEPVLPVDLDKAVTPVIMNPVTGVIPAAEVQPKGDKPS